MTSILIHHCLRRSTKELSVLRPAWQLECQGPRDPRTTQLASGGRVQQLLSGKTAAANKSEDVFGVGSIARVNDDVEADPAEGCIGAKAVDSNMKDVDVFGGENSRQ